nr:PREDICTED: interferon alpha/beta receptor 1 isoform X2 [Anolis carolinensis]|eukprot:XP_016853089.1 PREDICTED: interferon alpha/beta receptor 1 isoform X2 [Anolis carolinensis]
MHSLILQNPVRWGYLRNPLCLFLPCCDSGCNVGPEGRRKPSRAPQQRSMAVATWIVLLLLIDRSFQQGTWLLPPQNVTLSSENFYSFLTWNPAPDATRNTQYEVERTNGRSFRDWIQVASCGENNLKPTQRCQLRLSELPGSLFNFYKARVRAKLGARLSEWAISESLQLYKGSVLGPLDLFLAVADQDLTVSVLLPQMPLNNTVRRIIASLLKVRIILKEEGDDNTKEITMKLSTMNHTFESLKPNANYCITATVKDQQAKEAVKCIKTPRKTTYDDRTPLVKTLIALLGLTLLCLLGGASLKHLKHYLYPSSSEMVFPKSLTFVNMNALTLRFFFEPDDGSVTSLSMLEILPSNSIAMTEQEGSQIQMDRGRWVYCANGLYPDNMDNEDSSLFPFAVADSLSSKELLGNELQTQWAYSTSQELLGSFEHLPPARSGCPLYGLETVSWELTNKSKDKNRERKCPSLGRTDIPLSSVKLQSELDVQRTYVTVKDGGVYAEPFLPQASESQTHPGQSHSSKDGKLPDRSDLETRDRNTICFSGYECRPPILPCEL